MLPLYYIQLRQGDSLDQTIAKMSLEESDCWKPMQLKDCFLSPMPSFPSPRLAQATFCSSVPCGDTLHIFSFPSGSGFVMCSGKENPDSDADLDVDGDDTLEYGKPQYHFLEVLNSHQETVALLCH